MDKIRFLEYILKACPMLTAVPFGQAAMFSLLPNFDYQLSYLLHVRGGHTLNFLDLDLNPATLSDPEMFYLFPSWANEVL